MYASPQGIPSLADPIDRRLLKRRDVIFFNLATFLLIEPYKEKQLFVQQTLAAFLKMLNIIDDMESLMDW